MFRLQLLAGAAAPCLLLAVPAFAQSSTDARRTELLRQREAIDAELRSVDEQAAPPPAPRSQAETTGVEPGEIIVTGKALSLTTRVTGQTVTTIDDTAFRNTPATTIAVIAKLSPGVAVN